mgnify:FL=1
MQRLTTTVCLTLAVFFGVTGCAEDICCGPKSLKGAFDILGMDSAAVAIKKNFDPYRHIHTGLHGGSLPACYGDNTDKSWTNCYGKVHYLGINETYVGEFKNGFPDGKGAYNYNASRRSDWAGATYVGEFKRGSVSYTGKGIVTYADGRVEKGVWKEGEFVVTNVTEKDSSEPKRTPKSDITGSGFFVSKLGHIITNEHVVRKCGSVTVGDNANKQVTASVLETDKRNDLALLRISSTKMASAETKSLMSKLSVKKLGIKIVPLASGGLMRSDDVELGERVLVAGFPYGELYSSTIKVTGGMVSAVKGMGDDSAQFQMDAAVQPGNSGGPIYDENGNIVGVVIAQLNKLKVAKTIGSLPENVNFGIKASTVKQFLNTSGLPSSWSKRSKRMTTKDIAKIAKRQTVMVMCHR